MKIVALWLHTHVCQSELPTRLSVCRGKTDCEEQNETNHSAVLGSHTDISNDHGGDLKRLDTVFINTRDKN